MAADLFDLEVDVQSDGQEAKAPGLILRVHLKPGSGPTAILGRQGDALVLRVAPPPADPRANDAARSFLAELLSVSPESVELVSGEKSREKRFRTTGVEARVLRRQLDDEIDRAARGRGGARGGRGGR
ncbi:MAG TPA: DUF167 domain-containing protein [Acidimicrobiales bacterium]